jgi:hypothetical protein
MVQVYSTSQNLKSGKARVQRDGAYHQVSLLIHRDNHFSLGVYFLKIPEGLRSFP